MADLHGTRHGAYRRAFHEQYRREPVNFPGKLRRFAGEIRFRALLRPVHLESGKRHLPRPVIRQLQHVRPGGKPLRDGNHRVDGMLWAQTGILVRPGETYRRQRAAVKTHGEAAKASQRIGVDRMRPRHAGPGARGKRDGRSLELQRHRLTGLGGHPVVQLLPPGPLKLRIPVALHLHLRMARRHEHALRRRRTQRQHGDCRQFDSHRHHPSPVIRKRQTALFLQSTDSCGPCRTTPAERRRQARRSRAPGRRNASPSRRPCSTGCRTCN